MATVGFRHLNIYRPDIRLRSMKSVVKDPAVAATLPGFLIVQSKMQCLITARGQDESLEDYAERLRGSLEDLTMNPGQYMPVDMDSVLSPIMFKPNQVLYGTIENIVPEKNGYRLWFEEYDDPLIAPLHSKLLTDIWGAFGCPPEQWKYEAKRRRAQIMLQRRGKHFVFLEVAGAGVP